MVQVEAGLLSFRQIHAIAHPAVEDHDRFPRGFSPEHAVADLHSLRLGHCSLGPHQDRPGLDQFSQQGHDQLQPRLHSQRGHLDDQILAEAIDNQPAQAISLAENQPRGLLGIVVAQQPSQIDRGLQAMPPKRLVERLLGTPGIESDANAASSVVDSPGDESALVGHQIHVVAIHRPALHFIDRRVQHPGVPGRERPELVWLENDSGQGRT